MHSKKRCNRATYGEGTSKNFQEVKFPYQTHQLTPFKHIMKSKRHSSFSAVGWTDAVKNYPFFRETDFALYSLKSDHFLQKFRRLK